MKKLLILLTLCIVLMLWLLQAANIFTNDSPLFVHAEDKIIVDAGTADTLVVAVVAEEFLIQINRRGDMPLTPKGKKIQAAMKKQYGSRKGGKSSMLPQTKAQSKASKRKPHRLARKRNRLERLNLRRVVRQRAKAELTKLATILSQE